MYFRSIDYNKVNIFYDKNGFIVIKNFLKQNQIKKLKIKINNKKKNLKKIFLISKKLIKNQS